MPKQDLSLPRNPWTKPEKDFLETLEGSDHISHVCAKFKAEATRQGWATRTDEAIKTKMKRLKISHKAQDNGWSCAGLALILGVDRDRVHDWVMRGLLKSTKPKGRRAHRIVASAFREFAKNHPKWLTRIDRFNLSILLPEKTVETIIALPTRRPGLRLCVRSSRTGKVYPSVQAAAANEFFSRTTIRSCITKGRATRDGTKFSLVR